ncbi:MAG: metallophosphoesterase family protein [Bacteroidota bacterium]
MTKCFFVSDLHGHTGRYRKLFALMQEEKPEAVFFGGDLLPHAMKSTAEYTDFATDLFFPELQRVKEKLQEAYPEIFLIPGNDDPAIEAGKFIEAAETGIFHYINNRKISFRGYTVFGYCYIPPTPFTLKDWEKYDVSRYVDPGCTHPTEGYRSVEPQGNPEFETIKKDLDVLTEGEVLSGAIFLFHSPPYNTHLDRAALDGKTVDYVPLDVHVGSIAIKRLIDERQPHLTLHGHIHESTRITGHWKQQFQNTCSFNAAHDGPELSVIVFGLESPGDSERRLL